MAIERGYRRSTRGEVERQLAELDRATRLSRLAPAEPREVMANGTILSWLPPHATDGGRYTHYRVYAPGDADNKLVRQVSFDQLYINDGLTGDSVFVSTYNGTTGAESHRVAMKGELKKADDGTGGPGTGVLGFGFVYQLTLTGAGATLVEYAAPAKDGLFLTVDILMPNNNIPKEVDWGGMFDKDTPVTINDKALARNLFFFTAIGGRWTMLSYRGYMPTP
jgi:hypothetical protein